MLFKIKICIFVNSRLPAILEFYFIGLNIIFIEKLSVESTSWTVLPQRLKCCHGIYCLWKNTLPLVPELKSLLYSFYNFEIELLLTETCTVEGRKIKGEVNIGSIRMESTIFNLCDV